MYQRCSLGPLMETFSLMLVGEELKSPNRVRESDDKQTDCRFHQDPMGISCPSIHFQTELPLEQFRKKKLPGK